jgi:hypothetical protein
MVHTSQDCGADFSQVLFRIFAALCQETGGRCYDHNFQRFLPIFGEKIGVFLKKQSYDHNFQRFLPIFGEKIGVFLKNQSYDQLFSKFSFVLSQKTPIFSQNFSAKIF